MVESSEAAPVCWVVSDGRAGIENQAMGLAEAVARLTPLTIERKRIQIRGPWKHLPRAMWGDVFSKLSEGSDPLTPPYPDLWIACGRKSVPLTLAIKKRNPSTFTVQAQNPRAVVKKFDLVIPPIHDGLSGDNVLSILGAPHRVTAERIEDIASNPEMNAQFLALPTPRVAVLLGGPNRAYEVADDCARNIAQQLKKLSNAGAGLMITTSRRTPDGVANIIAEELAAEKYFLFDAANSTGERNPYFSVLGAADHILVTADSVNMATEAAATGKPLQIIQLSKKNAAPQSSVAKFERFHESLIAHGAARPFSGSLQRWNVAQLDETARAAKEILKRWRDG